MDNESSVFRFAIACVQNNSSLETLHLNHQPVNSVKDLNNLLDVINNHPSLNELIFNGICGTRMNGHGLLSLVIGLLDGTKRYDQVSFA